MSIRPFRISAIIFLILLGYFFTNYKFHPGISVSFQGTLDRDVRGSLAWDLGNGFLQRNSIEVLLSSTGKKKNSDLGKVTVEPSGIKNDLSHGYVTLVVISEYDYNNPDFEIEGRHHWGRWVIIKENKRGRQLALFPGSKVVFSNSSPEFRIKFFKTSQSGMARISSENGQDYYYDCYGKNKRWSVTLVNYYESSAGRIKFVKDPYRKRFATVLPLPHEKIHGLKLEQYEGDAISSINPVHRIVLKPTGKTFPVIVKNIFVNGRSVQVADQRIRSQGSWQDGSFQFQTEKDFFEINGKFVSYGFDIQKENRDAVQIFVDGRESGEQNSWAKKDGLLRISGQSTVSRIRFNLQSIQINSVNGQLHTIKPVVSANGEYIFKNIDIVKQNRFSPLLFCTQLVTAAILALSLYCTLNLPVFTEMKTLKDLPAVLFIRKGRWLFWLVLITGLVSNMLWLLAEWPGALTPDTVNVHGEVKRMLFTNHHPYLYSLFVLGLYNIHDSPLTVVLFQMFTFYLVIASWLYFLYRNGVRWFYLLPLYFLTFLSVPVNLFNITVWKDIPYNTLVLFWAFFITACYYLKRKGIIVTLRISQLFWLSLAFLFLCTFRHNGLVYILIVPLFLFLFTNIKRRWIVGFCLLSSLFLCLNYLVLPNYLLQDNPKKNDFAKIVVSRNVKQVTEAAGKDQGYYLEHFLADRTRKFVATLGASPKASTWYNDMHAPPQRWFSVDELNAEWIVTPKSSFLAKYKNHALKSRSFTGFKGGKFLHWNSGFGLLALIAVFLLYKWVPLSAVYSSFFLIQAAGMYFIVWPRWRYLYFLYLGGMYLVFVLLLESTLRKEMLEPSDGW